MSLYWDNDEEETDESKISKHEKLRRVIWYLEEAEGLLWDIEGSKRMPHRTRSGHWQGGLNRRDINFLSQAVASALSHVADAKSFYVGSKKRSWRGRK